MARNNLEERLTTLEMEVARLKAKVEGQTALGVPWWKQWAGAFLNDPIYEKAMKYGRQYRESLRPNPSKKRKGKNADS